jgi:hypothetical protein
MECLDQSGNTFDYYSNSIVSSTIIPKEAIDYSSSIIAAE